jgi:hypothetical protein
MTVIGTVRNGKIELPPGVSLPEGSRVKIDITEVEEIEQQRTAEPTPHGLLKFSGAITDLPPDSSVNVDHYLYGVP